MNGKHKLCLILTWAAIVLMASPLATALADCPEPPIVHLGIDPDSLPDSTKVLGSKANPAISLDQAHDICKECSWSAIFEFNPDVPYRYSYLERCYTWYPEKNGVPLAQSVVTALLGLSALGLLTWGFSARRRLKPLQTD